MNKREFSQLLYETSFDSTATVDDVVRLLSPLRSWIKENVPKRLFRYRECKDYNVASIKNDEIWGSTILEFNDPYECTPCYDIEKAQEYLNQMFSSETLKQIISLVKTDSLPPAFQDLFPLNSLDILAQALSMHTEDTIISQLQRSNLATLDRIKADWNLIVNSFFLGIKQAESETHIACFSERCDSSLMWGHYANSHKGFCLEYDFGAVLQACSMNCANPSLCNSFMLNFPIAPVTYSDSRLDATSYLPTVIQGYLHSAAQIPMNVYLLDVLLLAKCQLLKSSDWSYEQEWRLAYRSSSDQYVPHKCIAKVKPSGVYLGSRMQECDRATIHEICKERNIPCYIMLQNYTGQDYTLQTQPYEEFLKATQS